MTPAARKKPAAVRKKLAVREAPAVRAAPANRLYFGDCLEVMREELPDESVDLIYLDPPFNSKRLYNAFLEGAQWVAFKDTWRWSEAVDDYHETAGDVRLAPTMEGLHTTLREGTNLAYLSYMANRLRECRRVLKPTGSIYLHCDPNMSHYLKILMDGVFGANHFGNEIIWHYKRWSSGTKHFQRMHDVLLRYAGPDALFNILYQPYSDKTIHREMSVDKTTNLAATRDEQRGTKMDDVWDIPYLHSQSKERIGYPTQKPLALLERVIRASSNKGDIVLDPFCGCGTTIHAAQNLDRRWIGIDICVNACKVIEKRLRGHFDTIWDDVAFIGMPVTREDAEALAKIDPFRFERWASSLIDGMEPNLRQRGDKGIDGRGRLAIAKGKFLDMVSQVKSGTASPKDIQAFNGARQQAGADLGFFICFEARVTAKMRDAAAAAGRYKDTTTPAVQIYTIEDYFHGRTPDLPLKRR